MALDISWCSTRIATGSAVLGSDIPLLDGAGVRLVVDTRFEADDTDAYTDNNVAYLRFPTSDDGAPKPLDYWRVLLDQTVPLFAHPHHRLLFQCVSGVNRGPSAAYAVMVALGWTDAQARAQILAARPAAALAYAADALTACQSLGYA